MYKLKNQKTILYTEKLRFVAFVPVDKTNFAHVGGTLDNCAKLNFLLQNLTGCKRINGVCID